MKDYRELLFLDLPKRPKDASGKAINIDTEMEAFQKMFRQKKISAKIGGKIKEEFKSMDLKELYTKSKKEVK